MNENEFLEWLKTAGPWGSWVSVQVDPNNKRSPHHWKKVKTSMLRRLHRAGLIEVRTLTVSPWGSEAKTVYVEARQR